MTLGDITRLRAQKGEVDAALALHEERLAVYEALGDRDGIANTSWGIGHLLLCRKRVGEAAPLILKAYGILQEIGRLDGIAVVGVLAGQIMVAMGQRAEGLEVLRTSVVGFRKLGREADAVGVEAVIRRIEGGG